MCRWAVESRIYAEDPSRGYLPSTGLLTTCREPATPSVAAATGSYVRVDSGVEQGNEIGIHYDPMLAKLVTYGKDRDAAMGAWLKAPFGRWLDASNTQTTRQGTLVVELRASDALVRQWNGKTWVSGIACLVPSCIFCVC